MKLSNIVLSCLVCATFASNEVEVLDYSSAANTKVMDEVFFRSAEAHRQTMDSILSQMSTENALQILEKHNLSTPELMQVANVAMGKASKNLRKQPKGYAGLDGARKLLNDMIFESMSKYDEEVAKCTDYYSRQCAAMEQARSEISAANYVAAHSRALILDSQATINKAEVDIPTKKLELKEHLAKCKSELAKMNARLKIVMGDIAVMTMILEMTDCEKKLVQMEKLALLHCTDKCTKKSFVEFNHDGLQEKVSKLQSSLSHELMQDTFKDLFEGVESLESMEFLQTNAEITPLINKTKFFNPPVPRTKVPGNPCNGAPKSAGVTKCTIKKSPQCYKLQERFLLIQAGIMDERDELLQHIEMLKHFCEETTDTLQAQITSDEERLNNAQTKLAQATEKEADAGETARQTAAQNNELNKDLVKQMKTCSSNYMKYENEICALKKIRGELYRMKGDGSSAFFQDCEVSEWDSEQCTKVCREASDKEGGEQKLTRSVLTHPNGGAKCLPLAAMRSCSNHPCPVDCKLSAWAEWSKCSAECGGGVQQRLRDVKIAMKFKGKPCGGTSETKSCNAQACESNCKLSPWTKWSACSKDCDGGTAKRQKFVFAPAKGSGKCPGKWGKGRLQYKSCNQQRCQKAAGVATLTCNKKLDVVLLIDASGSLGKKGWDAEIKAAKMFVDAFNVKQTQAKMAVVQYSGPRTWGGVYQCIRKSKKKVDIAKTCKVSSVTHFESDLAKVKSKIAGLKWTQGSTLTTLALMAAKAELNLGRKDAQSVVVVITDGRPLSYRATGRASRLLRKSARLLWVPVTKFAPLKYIKKWATRRWEENVVPVETFEDLEKTDPIDHLIADMCPDHNPEITFD